MEDNKIKILAIDDNFDNLITIQALISEAFPFAETIIASNGKEGLALAASENPDVILLDIIMPEMDGFEVCKLLKADRKTTEIPVIFVTALNGDKESRLKGLEVGGDAFLAKPIDESELVAQMRAMIKIRQANIERANKNERLEQLINAKTTELKKNHKATLNLLEDLRTEIDSRKETELALRESEEKFRDMANLLPQIIFELDLKGVITYVNEQAYTISGYAVGEVIGQNSIQFYSPKERKKIKESFLQVIKGRISNNNSYKMLRKDGTQFPALIYINSISKNGEITGVRGILVDITEQKNSEKIIKESEQKYRLITEKTSDVVWLLDLKGNTLFVSQSIEKFTGYTVGEYFTQSNEERFTPNSVQLAANLIKDEISTYRKNKEGSIDVKKTLTLEYKCKNGNTKYGELLVSPYLDDENRLIGIHGVTRDITERKIAEDRLHESESLYRAILEASPDFIIITDLNGIILMASPSVLKKIGITDANKIIGNNIINYIVDEDRERMMMDFNNSRNGIKTGPNEYKSITVKGKNISLEVKGGFIFDSKGAISKIVFNARDITERKLAQKALEKSETKYREFVENSPEAIALYTDGIINYVNKECLRLMRASNKEQLIGMNVMEFIHPDNRQFVMDRMKISGQSEMNISLPTVEEKYIRLDGTTIYVEVKVMPLMVDDVPSVQLTARDVTDRKIVQEALIESENRYDTFINNNSNLIFVKDENLRYLVVNNALAAFFKLPKEKILQKTDKELLNNELKTTCNASDLNALNSEKPILIEEKLGDKIYETIKFPMLLANNKKGIGAIMRDITLRKISEKALEDSQQELQTIYDNAPVMMSMIGPDRKILFTNKAFSELIDSTEIEKEGKIGNVINCINSHDSILGCGFGAECKNCNLRIAIADTFKTGNVHHNIEYYSKAIINNKKISLLASTAIIQHKNQKNILLCFHDITDRKKIEDALQKSEMLLRTFIDNSPFEIWARDNNNIGILENKKFVDNYGSIIGVSTNNDHRIDSTIVKSWEKINERAFKGETVDEEYDFMVKNEKRFYQQIIFPIRNISKIIGIAGFNIDITERKTAEYALQETQDLLKKFAAHLQNVREEERVVLAREIHDELGQILVAMKIDMGILKNDMLKSLGANNSSSALVKVNDLIELIDKTIKTARKIMTNLRPEVLELLGFSEAVRLHAKNYQERFKTICHYKNSIPDYQFNTQQAIALFRIIQEAMNNTAKHAKATTIDIDIHTNKNNIILVIKDNGVGFDASNKKNYESYGLIGMKERIFLLDGELNISSKPMKGTKIQIKLPYIETVEEINTKKTP